MDCRLFCRRIGYAFLAASAASRNDFIGDRVTLAYKFSSPEFSSYPLKKPC